MNPLSNVESWLYHLGELDEVKIKKIADSDADLVVMDFSPDAKTPYTKEQLDVFRGDNNKMMVSYLSVGQAENYRSYWKPEWNTNPPGFISDPDPLWESPFVAYWDQEWKGIVFDYIDQIIDSGFNGLYLDIVDGFYFWEQKQPRDDNFYRDEMVKFVSEIRAYAKSKLAEQGDDRDFVIIGQNGEALVEDPAYLKAIDGIGKEDLFFAYPHGSEDQFGPAPDSWKLPSMEYLEKAKAAGVEIMIAEYIPPAYADGAAALLAKEIDYAKELGAALYVAEDRLFSDIYVSYKTGGGGDADPGGHEGLNLKGTELPDYLVGGKHDDYINGGGDGDVVDGGDGNDDLLGGGGHDTMIGGRGHDAIFAGDGHDMIFGGEGHDELSGGKGYDLFVFGVNSGWDIISDFEVGIDALRISNVPGEYTMYETDKATIIHFGGDNAIELTGVTQEDWPLIV